MKYIKKLSLVIHPFLFAMFFVMILYSGNVAEVSSSEIWIPLFASLGFALLLLLLSLLLIRLIRKLQKPQKSSQPYQIWDLKKAAIVASILIVLFFSFGHALIALGGWDDMHGAVGTPIYWLLLSVLWVGLLITGAYFVIQTRRDLHKLTLFLSIIAVTLVVIPLVNIIVNETKAAPQDIKVSEGIVDLARPDTLPDIYYLSLIHI